MEHVLQQYHYVDTVVYTLGLHHLILMYAMAKVATLIIPQSGVFYSIFSVHTLQCFMLLVGPLHTK